MTRYIVHVVVAGGDVSDDVYIGPYRDFARAVARGQQIERAATRAGGSVTALVREITPRTVALADVLADAGFDT